MAKIEIVKKEDLMGLEAEVDGLIGEVDQKSNKDHTHVWADIEDAPEIPDTSGLATKSEVEEVSGEVASKADSSHTHSYNDLSDKPDIPSTDGLASQTDLEALETIVNDLVDEVKALKGEDNEPEE